MVWKLYGFAVMDITGNLYQSGYGDYPPAFYAHNEKEALKKLKPFLKGDKIVGICKKDKTGEWTKLKGVM